MSATSAIGTGARRTMRSYKRRSYVYGAHVLAQMTVYGGPGGTEKKSVHRSRVLHSPPHVLSLESYAQRTWRRSELKTGRRVTGNRQPVTRSANFAQPPEPEPTQPSRRAPLCDSTAHAELLDVCVQPRRLLLPPLVLCALGSRSLLRLRCHAEKWPHGSVSPQQLPIANKEYEIQ